MKIKYKTEWDTCQGEGSYGKVYPAKVALVGEKVAFEKNFKTKNKEKYVSKQNKRIKADLWQWQSFQHIRST